MLWYERWWFSVKVSVLLSLYIMSLGVAKEALERSVRAGVNIDGERVVYFDYRFIHPLEKQSDKMSARKSENHEEMSLESDMDDEK